MSGRVEYRCIICFITRPTRADIRQHGFDDHIPQEHVDYRYPFTSAQLLVISARDEDKYNEEVRPRTLPLMDGICILREPPVNDPDGAAGLNWYSPPIATRSDWRVPWPASPKPEAKMCKTRSSLDCQLCGNPGCTMVCGNACMEAITTIASSTATLFQMQQATNRDKPLPFPTIREAAILRDAYDGSEPRGRPAQGAMTALVRDTGVGVTEIRAWFSAERRARGHSTPGDARARGSSAIVEVRTKLPITTKPAHPTSTFPLTLLVGQEEYVEEEIKVDVGPSWVQTQSGGASPYAYAGQYPYTPGYTILDTTPLFDGTDVESQDSGIGGSRREEIDLKDHGIEGCAAVRPPHTPSSRDPRIRKVSVAGPSRLYGRTSTPMIDPQNIASTEATNDASVSSDEEEKLIICLGDE